MAVLLKRYYCDINGDCTYSNWDIWIRWVVLVLIIIFFLALFFACSCQSARRRRRAGQQPYAGTGWTARPLYHGDQQYGNHQQYAPPPPQYSADVPQGHQGYYGQQSGVELQSPTPAYAPGRSTDNEVYQPPSGPPPAKGFK